MSRRLAVVFFSILLSLPGAAAAQEEIYDPLEPMNRGIFWFNDKFDIYVGEPVARAYDWALPRPVKKGVTNFFDNIGYPRYLVGDLIALKFGWALNHTGRFLINSTIGIGGLLDVASEMGLEHQEQDVGAGLAANGVPAGPYLVLPFLGPSNLRDAIGTGAEVFLTPWYWISAKSDMGSRTKWVISGSEIALEYLDIRSRLLDAVEAAKDSSLDYYLFSQSAYYQYRDGMGQGSARSDNWLQGGDDDLGADLEEEPPAGAEGKQR